MQSPHPQAPWRAFDDATREREYSPSSCIGGDYRPFIEAYRHRSAEARREAQRRGGRWQRLAVDHAPVPATFPAVELCLPPPAATAQPTGVLLFVHGGYWQELSAEASLFAAAACIERGWAFAAVDYTLAPAASVAAIVEECRRAFACLVQRAPALGLDARRIVVAGSSAGAHLAAMIALAPAPSDGGPGAAVRPCAAVLVSGVYWLQPLVGTSINAALGLDASAAQSVSPGAAALAGFPPALVAWGAIETEAFKQQSRLFAERLHAAGVRCETLEVAQRNHFDVILDLVVAESELGRRTGRLLDAG